MLSEKNFHKVVHDVVRRLNLRNFDKELSKRDKRTMDDLLSVWALMILEHTNLAGYTKESQVYFDLRRLFSPLEKYNLSVFFETLKSVSMLIVDVDIHSFAQLRATLSHENRVVLGGLIPYLEPFFTSWYVYQDVSSFRKLYNLLSFPSRVTFRDIEKLESSAEADYIAFEENFVETSPSQYMVNRVGELFPIRDRMEWASDLVPKLGPGSVAEGTTDTIEKYQVMYRTKGLDYLYRNTDNLSDIPFVSPKWESHHIAKVVFVPKSSTTLRTICMEPSTLMYHQQGAMAKIIDEIDTHADRRFSKRIRLEDQSINRDLAREGSLTGNLATIDLSNASDSVGASFCKKLFRKSSLLPLIYTLRSKEAVLPSGRKIELKKFAPMGSALCFPIECIVFAMIIEDTIVSAGDRVNNSRYSVYGDDLIIEKKYVDDLIVNLRKYGFEPNVSKSHFKIGSFIYRESCGGEYLNGIDISPIKISRKFSGFDGVPSSVVPTCVDMINRLHICDYTLARRYAISRIKRYNVAYSNAEGIFINTYDTSRRVVTRYNHGLHRPEYRHFAIKGKYRKLKDSEEEISYYHTLLQMHTRQLRNRPRQVGDIIDGHRIAERGARGTKRFFSDPDVADCLSLQP